MVPRPTATEVGAGNGTGEAEPAVVQAVLLAAQPPLTASPGSAHIHQQFCPI